MDLDFSLELKDIIFKYSGIGGSERMILDHISLEFNKQECTAIVGPSGSGKTTLIQQFTGLLKPISGDILFNGRNIWTKKFPLGELRRQIGLVFQFPESQLFEETVYKDISYGPVKMGVPEHEINGRVRTALQAVGLDFYRFAERSPFRLSEGEKRRIAIAGILAMDPGMVVFDEPTAGLDPGGVKRIENIVENLLNAGKSVVLVTHNMDFVINVATRVILMAQGQIVFDGNPIELFTNTALLESTGLEEPYILSSVKELQRPLPEFIDGPKGLDELLKRLNKVQKSIQSFTA